VCYNFESIFGGFLPRIAVESTKLVLAFADCNEVDKGAQLMRYAEFFISIVVIMRTICLLISLYEANELHLNQI
jgi:hypothetical protein